MKEIRLEKVVPLVSLEVMRWWSFQFTIGPLCCDILHPYWQGIYSWRNALWKVPVPASPAWPNWNNQKIFNTNMEQEKWVGQVNRLRKQESFSMFCCFKVIFLMYFYFMFLCQHKPYQNGRLWQQIYFLYLDKASIIPFMLSLHFLIICPYGLTIPFFSIKRAC